MSRTVKVTWALPDGMRRTVQPHLRPLLVRLPEWCRGLYICFDGEPDEPQGDGRQAIARMVVEVEYRRAKLVLGPPWLDQTEEERVVTLRHEMMHVVVQPMVDVFHRAIAHLEEKDPRLHALLVETHRHAWEGVVCDLAELWP